MKYLSIISMLCLSQTVFADPGHVLQVFAGDFDRDQTLIPADLSTLDLPPTQTWHLTDVTSGKVLPSQYDSKSNQLFFRLPGKLKARSSQRFHLNLVDQKESSSTVQLKQTEETIEFLNSKQPLLTYHKATVSPPVNVPEHYQRSGFIHPVVTPAGRVITDDFPNDHLHQHALFSAWTKCTFAGHAVDFWNQAKQTGTVAHRRMLESNTGPLFNSVSTELVYLDLTTPKMPVEVLAEKWTIRHYPLPDQHCFEIVSSQTCIAETPLTIEEYKYGGMAFRGNAKWRGDQGNFLTSEGKDRLSGNHTRPNWVSLYGEVDGKMCGIAIFPHSANFRSPQPARLHEKMPYFVFSPAVLGAFEISPNQPPLINRYLYLAFDGKPDVENFNRISNDYTHPPQAELTH